MKQKKPTNSAEDTGVAQNRTVLQPLVKTMSYYTKIKDLTNSNTAFSCVLKSVWMRVTLRKEKYGEIVANYGKHGTTDLLWAVLKVSYLAAHQVN